MANPEHIKIVKAGSDAVNEWWTNMGPTKPSITRNMWPISIEESGFLDLRHAELRGVNLKRSDLRYANFEGADLECANFEQAFLSYANFNNCNLRSANFERANMEEAQLRNAILEDANLSFAYIRHGYLTQSNLRNAKLAATFLVAGSLVGADLTRASMFATQLSFANLAGANLTGVCISNLGMEGWDINEVICQYFYTAEVGKIESYGRRNIKKTRVPKKGYLLEGEFEDRFKSRPTIEFIFENGMPSFGPAILDLAIVQANLKRPKAGLRLLDITARGGLPRAVIEITEQISKREALALVEACYQQKIKQMAGEIKELKQDKRSLLQVISQKMLLPAMESVEDEWIRITSAAKLLGVNKGTISHWADEGKISDNGKKKKERRVSKLSVLLLKDKREREDVLKDAADDLQDRASKIHDWH